MRCPRLNLPTDKSGGFLTRSCDMTQTSLVARSEPGRSRLKWAPQCPGHPALPQARFVVGHLPKPLPKRIMVKSACRNGNAHWTDYAPPVRRWVYAVLILQVLRGRGNLVSCHNRNTLSKNTNASLHKIPALATKISLPRLTPRLKSGECGGEDCSMPASSLVEQGIRIPRWASRRICMTCVGAPTPFWT